VVSLSLILTLYFQFTHIEKAYAASNFYTLSNGEWNSSLWSNVSASGANCGCNPGGNFNKTAYITKDITVSSYSPFKMSGGGIINILGNGKITFNSNVELSGGSFMSIDSLDTVIVNGNLLVSSSNIDVKGYFRVNGNATLTGGSNVCGTGTAFLNGTLTGSTWCGGVVLPIELLYFNVKQNNRVTRFSWATASETQNDYFTVQRSKDGTYFFDVLQRAGAGNSTSLLEYEEFDASDLKGLYYYRLKQTDYDGNATYSKVKAIRYAESPDTSALRIETISPNPFDDQCKITYSLPENSEVMLLISTFSGHLVYRESVFADSGVNTFTFGGDRKFAPGTYIVRLVTREDVVSAKVVNVSP
jgi:hypothetical protein